jgi:membrane-associated protein
MDGLLEQMWAILQPGVLFNSRELAAVLSRPEFMLAAYLTLTLIIFTETGLLIGFFLPGDSLLITVGMVVHVTHTNDPGGGWNLPLLMAILSAAAIIGDSVGYAIGRRTGPKIFTREQSLFFAKDHLLRAKAFYERYGGVTIILARFMPIIRTFAPVVAGVGQMNYRRFLVYNIVGGIGWIVSMLLVGYYLTTVIDPPFKLIFGPEFSVERHVEKVIVLVVLLSVAPLAYGAVRSWLGRMTGKTPAPGSVPTPVAQPQPDNPVGAA